MTLSGKLLYYGKAIKILPTSEDLQRFEQTPYYQSDHYQYIGDGYFYRYSDEYKKQGTHLGDVRASFYIWKPKTISVLGKKEANKIVPTQYYEFTLGTIGEGIVEPKYLIQFPHFFFIIILFIGSFCFMLAGKLDNFNVSYQILACAYFLVVFLTLFSLFFKSNYFHYIFPRIIENKKIF